MLNKKLISLILAAIMLAAAFSGCAHKTPAGETPEPTAEATVPAAEPPTAEPTPPATEQPTAEPTPPPTEQPKYEFDPHLYLPLLAGDVPQEYWDAFHNLCDALRAGETTFECASEAAYKWALDPTTLTELFPPACMMVKSESSDGTTPFENGVGRIYYQIPVEEYVERQANFEALVEDVLNTWLEPDDDEFEKCLKLYAYMEYNYSYDEEFHEITTDGANYDTIMRGKGQCIELSSVYAYFLLQAGVQALQVGCCVPTMAHAWTYIIINGKGYHSDPTWALRASEDDPLPLYYFMMNSERRASTGCPVDDLQVPLLPRYWDKFSITDFPADDDEYCFPSVSFLISIDEVNKTVSFTCEGEVCERSYALPDPAEG